MQLPCVFPAGSDLRKLGSIDASLERVQIALLSLALADLSCAVLDRNDQTTKQAQRKIESLQSLRVFAASWDSLD